MKGFIGLVVGVALLLGWGVRPADAGSVGRARLEGAAIALGTIGLIAVLSDAAQAQPVAISVGAWYPAYPAPAPCPPPVAFAPAPHRGRVWVPGYWDEIDVWVPQVRVPPSRGRSDCDDDRHRGYGHRKRHGHDRCGSGSYLAREDGGRYERRRVWKEGYYR